MCRLVPRGCNSPTGPFSHGCHPLHQLHALRGCVPSTGPPCAGVCSGGQRAAPGKGLCGPKTQRTVFVSTSFFAAIGRKRPVKSRKSTGSRHLGFIVTTSSAKSGPLIHEKIRGPLFFVSLRSKFGRQGGPLPKGRFLCARGKKAPQHAGILAGPWAAQARKAPCRRRHAGAAPAGRRLLALAHVGAVSVFPFGALRLRRPVT